jgi:hypothetical protein
MIQNPFSYFALVTGRCSTLEKQRPVWLARSSLGEKPMRFAKPVRDANDQKTPRTGFHISY